ncbi:type II toxin-antitoxin system HicA family toxin [Pediococcus pentosaceus]|uniref:type II toxin-antitoxin system HicA family toxin n=1 Tax=Pediococcus pentosaceus TaxID=1255 RepID=UPI001109BD0F|nr:type II toxin-antitoxin system HicA family toxin [Pediococcus pentosaceus]KAF0422755.1 addiction module toxin, HicA family [Pediococcus pentosaceus]TLQ02268.1 type II toxin-antitoxin system HicA family toxin [Pediococcus pentosaceus]
MIKISSVEKLKAKFFKNPVAKDLKFNDAKKLLISYGCKLQNNSGGSHYAVTHINHSDTLILPKHTVPLKRYNIKQIRDFISDIENAEEEK